MVTLLSEVVLIQILISIYSMTFYRLEIYASIMREDHPYQLVPLRLKPNVFLVLLRG